jgi:hypothetical protein
MTSARSSGFFRPAKAILLPGMASFGLLNYLSRLASFQSNPASFIAFE